MVGAGFPGTGERLGTARGSLEQDELLLGSNPLEAADAPGQRGPEQGPLLL